MLDIDQIHEILPHRYPFLLVDRILELEPGKHVIGLKNVTCNEEFFQGHFPGLPVMPGVLIIEAMAQVGGVLLLSLAEYSGKIAFFAGVDKVKFRQSVVPGDQLITEAEMVRIWPSRGMGILRCVGRVGDKVVAEGELKFVVKDNPNPDGVTRSIGAIGRSPVASPASSPASSPPASAPPAAGDDRSTTGQ